MTQPLLATWEERLGRLEEANRRLERACRRWKRAGVAALAGLALLAVGGAAAKVQSSLDAGEFVLRDEAGTMRASLTMRPDGTPGLGLFDKQGQIRLSLDLDPNDAPGVHLYGQTGAL